jgi:hypothetical protein
MFNMFPATPATARLGEPLLQPNDTGRRGLGDIDCDMLADADEYGVARAPAKDMVMRRAARERGVKVKYHGGTISALCIDFEYTDPRPQGRREGEEGVIAAELEAYNRVTAQWESDLAEAAKKGELVPPKPQDPRTLLPDWSAPYEVVRWNGIEHLADFETKLYDLGFVPNGRGF